MRIFRFCICRRRVRVHQIAKCTSTCWNIKKTINLLKLAVLHYTCRKVNWIYLFWTIFINMHASFTWRSLECKFLFQYVYFSTALLHIFFPFEKFDLGDDVSPRLKIISLMLFIQSFYHFSRFSQTTTTIIQPLCSCTISIYISIFIVHHKHFSAATVHYRFSIFILFSARMINDLAYDVIEGYNNHDFVGELCVFIYKTYFQTSMYCITCRCCTFSWRSCRVIFLNVVITVRGVGSSSSSTCLPVSLFVFSSPRHLSFRVGHQLLIVPLDAKVDFM